MTLDLQTSRVVFKGNGAAVEFPFDFKVWDASQIAVFVSDDPDGINEMEVTPQKVILTESGGTVTYTLEGKPLPEGYTLSIVRNMPFIQEDMYITGTRFNPEVIETRFDKDCAERQQILEMLSRCIKVSVTSDMTPEQLLKAIFKAYHDILESLASTGSITGAIPVVATGTTEPRPLKDRFADIINVKDFGAKGDGMTDDTEAFEKAIASDASFAFVSPGVYKLTKWIRGNFCSAGKVRFVGGGYACVKSLTEGSTADYRRDVVMALPHKFPGYDDVKAQLGVSSTSGFQQFAIDYDSERIYCLYMFGKGTDDIDYSVIVIYDFSRTFLGYNIVKLSVGVETFSITSYARRKIAFMRDDATTVKKFYLESFTGNGSVVEPIQSITLPIASADLLSCTSDRLYLPTNGSSQGTYYQAFPIYSYTFSGECKGFSHTEWVSAGPKYDSSKFDTNAEEIMASPKLQNFCKITDGFMLISGSTYNNTDGLSDIQVIREVAEDGSLRRSISLSPSDVIQKLTEHGLSAVSIEAEGICVANGHVFTAYTYNTESHTEGIVIFLEDAKTASSDSYVGALTDSSPRLNINRIAAGRYPTPTSKFVDPLTGQQITDFVDVLKMMATYQIPRLSFFQPHSGITLPEELLTDSSSPFLEILNESNKDFCVRLDTSYHVTTFRVSYDLETNAITNFAKLVLWNSGLVLTPSSTAITPSIRVGKDVNGSRLFSVSRPVLLNDGEACNMAWGGVPSRSSSESYAAVSLHEFFVRNQSDAVTSPQRVFALAKNVAYPGVDATVSLGNGAYRWSEVFSTTGSINTSDAREKQDVAEYPDAVLDAWGKVTFRQFLFRDAVDAKGDAARIHSGVIAQQVVKAFEKHGLDATRYGLLCYDEWPDEYEDVEVVDVPAVLDSEGNEVTPAKSHTEQRLVTAAGDRYGIRYSEALCLEAAYQRRRADRIEARLAALEKKLGSV